MVTRRLPGGRGFVGPLPRRVARGGPERLGSDGESIRLVEVAELAHGYVCTGCGCLVATPAFHAEAVHGLETVEVVPLGGGEDMP